MLGMKLTVVYDNQAKEGLRSGWGFSCYIESPEKNILFDTGWDGHLLLDNMNKLALPPEDVDILVLSHSHWDHIGGLPALLNENSDLEVYVPSGFSASLKMEISSRCRFLHEIKGPQEICMDIRTTGELGNKIKEQSLVLGSGGKLYVVSGCSHPGLKSIMDTASIFGDVKGIIGGLHDSREYDQFAGIEFIGAGHCTQHKKKIREMYTDSFEDIFAGYVTEI